MGVAQKFNCYIVCHSTEACEKFLALFGTPIDINTTLADYHGEPCYIDIQVTDSNGAWVEIEIFSERSQNAEWQHELFIKFIREKAGKELLHCFSSHAWLCGEGDFINFDEDE